MELLCHTVFQLYCLFNAGSQGIIQTGKVRCAGLLQESLSARDICLCHCSSCSYSCFFNDAFKFFQVDRHSGSQRFVDVVVRLHNRNKSVNEIENQ